MEAQPLPTELAIPYSDWPLLARLPTLDDLPAIVDACQDPEIYSLLPGELIEP